MTAERKWINIMGQADDCPCADIGHLQRQLKEKDAMIDWLADKLISNTGLAPVEDWRKAAQEAVKKDD